MGFARSLLVFLVFWFAGELFNETRPAYASPSKVCEDSTQFVAVMAINPHFVGIPLGIACAVSAAISAWIGRRFVNLVL
jgi:hypothetical protein